MDRLSPHRSFTPLSTGSNTASVITGEDFRARLSAVLKNSSHNLNSGFNTLINQLPAVKAADRPSAANQLIEHTFFLGHEEQMAVIIETIDIINQSIEHKDPAIKESIALTMEQEIATATDLSYAPAANVFPLYSMLMQMAEMHDLKDFAIALALRLTARIADAPPHHRDSEFNAGIVMISWCPPDLQRAFIVELLKLLPKGLDAKIDALERMKEQAAKIGRAHV